MDDQVWMEHALALAEMAGEQQEVPVGCVVVYEGQMIGQGANQPISQYDPTAHAEIVALRHAAQAIGNYRLPGATLYVTLEPCLMCLGAMLHARIDAVVYGAEDPKLGVFSHGLYQPDHPGFNHRLEWQGGMMAEEAASLLTEFFASRR